MAPFTLSRTTSGSSVARAFAGPTRSPRQRTRGRRKTAEPSSTESRGRDPCPALEAEAKSESGAFLGRRSTNLKSVGANRRSPIALARLILAEPRARACHHRCPVLQPEAPEDRRRATKPRLHSSPPDRIHANAKCNRSQNAAEQSRNTQGKSHPVHDTASSNLLVANESQRLHLSKLCRRGPHGRSRHRLHPVIDGGSALWGVGGHSVGRRKEQSVGRSRSTAPAALAALRKPAPPAVRCAAR